MVFGVGCLTFDGCWLLAGSCAGKNSAPLFFVPRRPFILPPDMHLGPIAATLVAVSLGAVRALVAITAHRYRAIQRIAKSSSYITLFSKSFDNIEACNYRDSGTFRCFESNSYESGLKALQVYYKLHGDLVIPRSYEVPDGEGRYFHVLVSWMNISQST